MSSIKEEKSAGPIARHYESIPNNQDSNPRNEDVNASSRDITDGISITRLSSDPVTDLKEILSQWDSPHPEVRAAVKNYDEDIPANTIRAWTIGMFLVIIGASMNTLFSLRLPSIGLGALIAQIIAWSLGHGWAKVMPKKQFNIFGIKWSLNPGPFNIKEHSIIVVMASVSFSAAYATDVLLAQIAFYKQAFGLVFQLLLVISTQSFGYGIAGMLRKFLVYPAAMIWPANLVSVTLMNAMYENNERPDPNIFGGKIHRYKWFAYVTAVFSFITWIAPNNVVVNQLFGGTTGLSFIPLTFDWTQISGFVGSPMIPPKQIWAQFRNSTKEETPDIHMKMMQKYPEAPNWWYMSLFILMIGLSLITILAFPTNLTWWAFLIALGISFFFSLPIGIIQAITNTQIGLNVLTEFIFGYLQPGKPLALMIFKTYGYITMSQALGFVSDLKFGHYIKIPPRTMFMAQVVATTFSCFIQVGILNHALNNIPEICTPHQPSHFTCPGGRVFFSASIIWGLIGLQRIFSPGQIYSSLFIFFAIGALLTIAIYLLSKRYPKSPLKYLMAPLIFGGAAAIPPATPLNYLSWGIVGFIFQKFIRGRYFAWWSRLSYLTSSALDLGLALSTIFIFVALTVNWVEGPKWWGNSVVGGTLDAQGIAVQKIVGVGEHFGPDGNSYLIEPVDL
ncbi:hypothetical protein EYC80_010429 [Monilinia laxa]|uniref:OPT family small oligopeptide transporter n=1 Tax=Monilinia laxa TaxID=61186 RepID=A0A5N6JMX4_MONLA|nr:hypothetical protein EYC80_010429 [Monilinia laxa]